jgi:hypothetical protein
MVRRLYVVLVLTVMVLGCQTRAPAEPTAGDTPQTYAIKLKEIGKGETVLVERTFRETSETQIESAKGTQKQVDKKAQDFVFRETVLDKAAGQQRPSRLQRAYEKAEVTVNDKAQTLPLQGRTVLIERMDGKYGFQPTDNKELSAEALKVLAEEFAKDGAGDLRQLFMPAKPVGLKDPWRLELAPLIKELSRSLIVDKDKAHGTGKLLKVRKDKEGRLFGEMEFQIEMPLRELVIAGGDKVPLQPGAEMSVVLTLDACIDGSIESGTLKSDSTMTATALLRGRDGARIKMVLDSKSQRQEVRREVPAK